MNSLLLLAIVTATLLTLGVIGITGVVLITSKRLIHPLVLFGVIYAYFIVLPAWWFLWNGPDAFQYALEQSAYTQLLTLLVCSGVFFLFVGLFTFVRYDASDFAVLNPHSTAFGRQPYAGDGGYRTGRLSRLTNRPYFQPSLFALGLLGFAVGVVSYIYLVTTNGGLAHMLTVTPRTKFFNPTIAPFVHLSKAGVVGGFVTVWVACREQIETRSISWIQGMACVATFIVALGVIVTFRARMEILVVLAVAAVFLYTADILTNRLAIMVGAVCVGFIALFSVIEALFLPGPTATELLLHTAVHTTRYNVLVSAIESVPSEYPYQFGVPWIHAIIINVPGTESILLYGDHMELITAGQNWKYRTFSGMLFGDLWLNFGIVGLIVGMCLLAVAVGYIDLRYERARWLERGVYAPLLVSTISFVPENVTWGTRHLVIGLLLPVGVAIIGAVVLGRLFSRIDREKHSYLTETQYRADDD